MFQWILCRDSHGLRAILSLTYALVGAAAKKNPLDRLCLEALFLGWSLCTYLRTSFFLSSQFLG